MNTSKADPKVRMEWKDIDWNTAERRTFKLQKRIYQASSRGDIKAVRRLQKTLIRSWSAKLLAVRKVTQDNQGKKTAGVDGIKSLSPEARLHLAQRLKPGNKAKPTRRVWIPKPGKEEKRPLEIPTIHDRALQTLLKLALEPEWEAKFELNSYGFRPGRSCHDAIEAIFTAIAVKPKYVLDADISKCFDRINHRKLIEKLNTFPTMRRQIKAWLKSGTLDGKELFPTDNGTPQGGTISPLLANIALHGMEQIIKDHVAKLKLPGQKNRDGWKNRRTVSVIRYADDFVILHKDLEVINECKVIVSEWLKDIGLELKPEKTSIAHTMKEYNGNPAGFNFLGFHIKQYGMGKYNTGNSRQGEPLGFKTLIRPSKEKIKQHLLDIAQVIQNHKAAPQEALIKELNPKITGWSRYYSTVVSKQVFTKCDHWTYEMLRSWAKRRHPTKSGYWVTDRYWHSVKGDNWTFATKRDKQNYLTLQLREDTQILRHTKVKDNCSPYDGNTKYWSSRFGKHPELPTRVAILLKNQKGKCAYCGHTFKEEDLMEVDHIIPCSQGGRNEYKNLQLLHRHCHDSKTAEDTAARGMRNKHHTIEEPDEAKVSRPVLKTSREDDFPA
ncbi:MAG: group II intron reverse transcriptase/maturase [Nostoc sp. ChiQUE01a]|nr:group II intron reverse transcriptase/maturase [Nostoc sp. ChiQUE01a]